MRDFPLTPYILLYFQLFKVFIGLISISYKSRYENGKINDYLQLNNLDEEKKY
jgi:hypothetical protein